MDQTEQTIHPAVLTAAEPAFGPGWLLLARTPKGPSEERLLGTRTVLISLTGATADQLQRAAAETLNLYDRDASASPAERARRALTAAQKLLGEKVAIGLVALSRNEVLVARTSGVAIAARRTTDGRTATIMLPDDYLGSVLALCNERRGQQVELTYVGARAMLVYRIPLNEVVFDFYDRLKSVSRGYASFDYQMDGYDEGDLVKISILVNNEPVDALSFMAHRAQAERRGRQICEKLKELIPRQLFKIPIQAAIGGRVIARETISALSKDVTAKCYGGDISRKRKLLEKQKEGKKRMRQFGKVEIPQSAFIAALKMDS